MVGALWTLRLEMMMFLLSRPASRLEVMIIINNIADIPYVIIPNECLNVSAHAVAIETNNELL